MDKKYDIVSLDKPDDSVWDVIGWGLHKYNEQQAGESQNQQLCFVLRDSDQKVVGGLIGSTYWNWFYIDLLFVIEELRGLGYGHQLLELAEDEARKRGAKNVYLDTFSFQVPHFYKQHGYHVFGELKDFPAGHQRYFFTKSL
ncbi:MAG: GNAT family N-acetyltransferase [Anaerolineaceae bacterium]|nr:GNAT family N-acetyltransferase [Anaerolineaceae bacterium]